jgi:hypothetical protein
MAGFDNQHYAEAGRMLTEAKEQVSYGGWGRWLTKNFELSQQQARLYMQWARVHDENASSGREVPYASMRVMRGATEHQREDRQSKQQQAFRRVLRDVARDDFVQERQTHNDEIKLHRDLAEELMAPALAGPSSRGDRPRGGFAYGPRARRCDPTPSSAAALRP